MTDQTLSLPQARRIALAAQGFADRRPTGRADVRHLRRVIGRIGVIQMDSVNVLARAHYLPLYSRLGAYDVALLDRAAYRSPRQLFEYWGHEASLVPVSLHPLLRWRMADGHGWDGPSRLARERPDFVRWVLEDVRSRGPATAADLEYGQRLRTDHWGWNWSDVKTALESLFWAGEVVAAGRNSGWARLYDVPERVLPEAVLQAPTPSTADAHRELVRLSAAALGVAAEAELRDYFRLPARATRTAIAELIESGELAPVRVHGWKVPAYLHAEARLPRQIEAATLLSPFDPVMWERARVARLFDFAYRIEIYVPKPLRVHGYYVLPFLLGDRLVARVDLKADRQAGVLRVPAAWAEPARASSAVAAALAVELHRLAGWLGLVEVDPPERGDLADALSAALRPSRRATAQPDAAARERAQRRGAVWTGAQRREDGATSAAQRANQR
jgi:uncharacterized protein